MAGTHLKSITFSLNRINYLSVYYIDGISYREKVFSFYWVVNLFISAVKLTVYGNFIHFGNQSQVAIQANSSFDISLMVSFFTVPQSQPVVTNWSTYFLKKQNKPKKIKYCSMEKKILPSCGTETFVWWVLQLLSWQAKRTAVKQEIQSRIAAARLHVKLDVIPRFISLTLQVPWNDLKDQDTAWTQQVHMKLFGPAPR